MLNSELPDLKQQMQEIQGTLEFMQGKMEKYKIQNEEMEVRALLFLILFTLNFEIEKI
jgi:hypothetical protein